MDLNRFDDVTVAVAEGQTRRKVLGTLFGGSLAVLLGASEDAAAKSACAKKCKKKNGKKARRKCQKRCQAGEPIAQQGTATLTSQSAPDCAIQGTCIDAVAGTLTGTPIASGTFQGDLTGTNFQPGSAPDTFTADFTGTLTATETSTGDTLVVPIVLVLTQNQATGALSFVGTHQIAGGTGRFAGATGSGEIAGSGTRTGQSGTVQSFSMNGTIVFA